MAIILMQITVQRNSIIDTSSGPSFTDASWTAPATPSASRSTDAFVTSLRCDLVQHPGDLAASVDDLFSCLHSPYDDFRSDFSSDIHSPVVCRENCCFDPAGNLTDVRHRETLLEAAIGLLPVAEMVTVCGDQILPVISAPESDDVRTSVTQHSDLDRVI